MFFVKVLPRNPKMLAQLIVFRNFRLYISEKYITCIAKTTKPNLH